MLDDQSWKKDEKPYVVFACSKCKQYSYVKQTQKTKKCLRCGKIYQVKNILNGIIVKGINNALDTVKEKQNELSSPKLGLDPAFHTAEEFLVNIPTIIKLSKYHNKQNSKAEKGNYEQFKLLLEHLSKKQSDHYKKTIPDYLIALVAENYNIQKKDLDRFISKALRDGFLKLEKNNYYAIRV